jgi:hypothetical protein
MSMTHALLMSAMAPAARPRIRRRALVFQA